MRVLAAVFFVLSASALSLTNVSAQQNNQKLSVKEEQEGNSLDELPLTSRNARPQSLP